MPPRSCSGRFDPLLSALLAILEDGRLRPLQRRMGSARNAEVALDAPHRQPPRVPGRLVRRRGQEPQKNKGQCRRRRMCRRQSNRLVVQICCCRQLPQQTRHWGRVWAPVANAPAAPWLQLPGEAAARVPTAPGKAPVRAPAVAREGSRGSAQATPYSTGRHPASTGPHLEAFAPPCAKLKGVGFEAAPVCVFLVVGEAACFRAVAEQCFLARPAPRFRQPPPPRAASRTAGQP